MKNNVKAEILKSPKTKKHVVNIAGKWQEITTVYDEVGNILSKIVSPLKVEFSIKDVLQVIIGAALLALPVGFTEETWKLGEQLPMQNVIWFPILSILFIGLFVYYNYYKKHLKLHYGAFLKRVICTYIFAFVVVAILMHIIQQTPWESDWMLALKRVLIVTFPCALSGTLADTIK